MGARPDDRPTETDIAKSLGLSLGTVRKAFDILVDLDLLERHQGRGTVVPDIEHGERRNRFSNIRDRSGTRVSGNVEIDRITLGSTRRSISPKSSPSTNGPPFWASSAGGDTANGCS